MPVWNVLVLNQCLAQHPNNKLPVREDQIQNSLSKIQVGFLAKLVKKTLKKWKRK
jgi:hypothetical protein